MKNYFLKFLALGLVATFTLASCDTQRYNRHDDRRHHHHDNDRDHHDNDREHDDHYDRNY